MKRTIKTIFEEKIDIKVIKKQCKIDLKTIEKTQTCSKK